MRLVRTHFPLGTLLHLHLLRIRMLHNHTATLAIRILNSIHDLHVHILNRQICTLAAGVHNERTTRMGIGGARHHMDVQQLAILPEHVDHVAFRHKLSQIPDEQLAFTAVLVVLGV